MSLRALYVDFNSYFASVEQQLRPELRGKPIGVLPVLAETTCCIAASYAAKAFGVKTGTRVSEARVLCPDIIFVEARPAVYVEFHHRLIAVVESCTHVEKILSIDEMVCMLTGSQQKRENALALADHIKRTIAEKVGHEIRSSIGIAPNTFLAKVASNMQKPDGCVVIEASDIPEKLYVLKIRDLNGIGKRMEERLVKHGIATMPALYAANRQQLRAAWGGVEGERMYDKLRGLEPPDAKHQRSSLGHSHVLPPELRTYRDAFSVLHRLLQKAAMRLRSHELHAGGVQLRVKFINQPTWETGSLCSPTDDTLQLIHILAQLWQGYPAARRAAPYAVGVTLTHLAKSGARTLDLFEAKPQNRNKLDNALDLLNQRYGTNTVYFGGAHAALDHAPMRIAFTHIPDLEIEDDSKPSS
jgi:DNA polymerase-4